MSVRIKQIPLEEEYKKHVGITPQDVTKLREWLRTQPHLPGDHITDLELILAYHCCNRSSEVSKQLLDLHFTVKTLFTIFFKDRSYDDKMKSAAKVMLYTPLEVTTREGYGVFFTHLIDRDPKSVNFVDVLRLGLMRLDVWQYEKGSLPGFVLIMDMDGMTLSHFAKLELQALQQYLYYLQEATLGNPKALHFINAPPFMDRLMSFIKPFLKSSLLQMVHIHQVGASTLDQFFCMENLPEGILGGGKGTHIKDLIQDTEKTLMAAADFFAEENMKRVVESKRPGKPKNITDIFGSIEGSFKKLDID